MLRTVPHPHSLRLLDFLAPSLICRTRTFSSMTASKESSTSGGQAKALQHKKIRDIIMGEVHTKQITPGSLKVNHNNYLTGIHNALAEQNLVQALILWDQMKKKREDAATYEGLYQLPEHVERKISSLYLTQFLKLQKEASGKLRSIAKDFALSAAARDMSDALYEMMLDHIVRNETQSAIDLYTSYQTSVEKPDTQKQDTAASDTGLVITDEEDADPSFNPGRVSLLLAVITAYAIKDSFQDALSTYITANIRPPTYRQLTLLRTLDDKPELKAKVEHYMHRLGVASLVSRPISLSKHIMNISSARSTKLLEQLYNDVIDGISGPSPYLAVDASALSPTRIVAMTEAGWTAFQTGFLKSERPDLASKIWKDLDSCAFTPGVSMWTALIDVYANLRDSRQAMVTWNRMLQSGIKPDTLCYRAMINALFDDNNAEAGLLKFKEYHQSGQQKNGATISVYNTVLRGLLRLKRVQDANALLAAMRNKGPTPDIISFNTFLSYYCRQHDFKGLSEVVQQMSAMQIAGDVVTFSTILTALLNAGRKDADSTILSLMRKQGIKPNVATYSAIIDHQLRQETEESLTAALNILDKMEQEEDTMPNEVTFTSILAGIYRNPGISRERAEDVKADIIRRMRRAHISFRVPTYHILIRAALDSKAPEGYLDAISLLDDMERQGHPRTNTVWYILFAGLMYREQWDVARIMVEKMEQSGHETSPRVQKLVNDIKQK